MTPDRKHKSLIALWLACSLAACGPSGPPLTATDVVAVAPLPGRTFSAAYLTLHNQSREPVTISGVSSTDFVRVEIHESQTVDDVIHMRRLESVIIDAGTSMTFEAGGKHLMLIEPVSELLVGQSIAIQFQYDNGGTLILSTPLTERK